MYVAIRTGDWLTIATLSIAEEIFLPAELVME